MSSVHYLTTAAERHKSWSFYLLYSQFRTEAEIIFRICETGLNVAFAHLDFYAALSGTISCRFETVYRSHLQESSSWRGYQ